MNNNQVSKSSTNTTNNHFRFFFPRKNNESYPIDTNHRDAPLFLSQLSPLPTVRELKIVNDIFNKEVIDEFSKLSNDYKSEIFFVIKIIKKVFDYYDSVKFFVIEKVVTNLDGESKLESILKELDYNTSIHRSINYLRNKKWKTSNKKFHQNHQITSKQNYHDVIQYTQQVHQSYDENDLIDTETNTNWYSCIHSLYEKFEFILFDRSHLVKPYVPIHQCLRIKLIFPKEVNMMLLFHGHLAHNGASSLYESDSYSFNYHSSIRLFSYVDKVSENSKVRKTGVNTRSSGYQQSNQSYDGKIAHEGTQECSHNCEFCDKFLKKNRKHWKYFGTKGLGHFSIDLLKCYNDAKNKKSKLEKSLKKRKLESHFNQPLLIAGSLEQNGWAVYEGVSVVEDKYLKLHGEICHILYGRGLNSKWKTIDTEIGGERQYLRISDITKKNEFKTLFDFFDDIEDSLKKLDSFQDSGFQKDKRSILRNKGNTPKQVIHRDQTHDS